MILVLDNYDSFVHNIAHALAELGEVVEVVRSDRISVDEALRLSPTHLVLSPGPGRPEGAGISVALVRAAAGRIPTLGVCLGHQAIAAAYGARVVSSPEPRHGRDSAVVHNGVGILAGLPSPFPAGRYHSLTVDESSLPNQLEPVAWTRSGELMAVRDRSSSVWGVQFHPESILTPGGPALFAAFLRVRPLSARKPAYEPYTLTAPDTDRPSAP